MASDRATADTFSVRWENIRSFEDTRWWTLKPLTVLVGANNSGKTSLLSPFLLLKQTLRARDQGLGLMTSGPLFNAGLYEDLAFRHDVMKHVKFSFAFSPSEYSLPGPFADLAARIGGCSFTFQARTRSATAQLREYAVTDASGSLILRRRFRPPNKYSFEPYFDERQQSARGSRTPFMGNRLTQLIDDSMPEHFLFSLGPDQIAALIEDDLVSEENTDLFFSYYTIVNAVQSWLRKLLRGISYIGPLRERPRRFYEVSGEMPWDVGVGGEDAPEIIFRNADRDLLKTVSDWLRRFHVGPYIEPVNLGPGAFALRVQRTRDAPWVNYADSGFGLSQVLPLIVQGFFSPRGSRILAEQPEIHLNPRLQRVLADLFVAVALSGRSVLIETHSEHLVLRLRTLIAEGAISSDDVNIVYVEKDRDVSVVRQVPVQANGHIARESWPAGFFEDSVHEALALAAAQAGRRRDAR